MMENYKLAEEIVSRRFLKEETYYPVFLLCIYGLLNVFNDDKEIVSDVFNNLNIYIESKKITDILKDNKVDIEDIFGISEDSEDLQTCGISCTGISYKFDGKKFILEEDQPFIAISLIDADINYLILAIMHEVAHLIKSHVNITYSFERENLVGYYLRCGVNLFSGSYNSKKKEAYYQNFYNILDEVINCQHTTEAANYILDLEGLITDFDVLEIFNSLDKDVLKKDFGYEMTSELFSSLWKNNIFKDIINKNIVFGNIDGLTLEYEEIMGESSFLLLNELLEDYEDLIYSGDSVKVQEIQNKFNNLVKEFNEKTLPKQYIKQ